MIRYRLWNLHNQLSFYLDEVIVGDGIDSGDSDVEPWYTKRIVVVVRVLQDIQNISLIALKLKIKNI